MLVLGIEATCDETAIAVVRNGTEILSNVIASSSAIHALYGGVFPELACQQHIDLLIPTLQNALKEAHVTPREIDLIAVAKGPGLIGALLIGLNAAKGLALSWNKPLVGVHHVEAHLYAAMMGAPTPWLFPALGLVVSGGHTLLLHILEVGSYEQLGSTVDDALGEAFDKAATLLDLPYPGGPEIERLARQGNPQRFPFRAGQVKQHPLHFSFSGLKTAVLYAVKGPNGTRHTPSALDLATKQDIAASFQEAAFRDLIEKIELARRQIPCKAIFLGGGVSCNAQLRRRFHEHFPSLPLFWPPSGLSLDNGAMIAGLGYQIYRTQGPDRDPLNLTAMPRIPFRSLQKNETE